MADIFSNMFFCSRASIESPRSTSPPPPRRKSMGGQDLTEYLKAFRNNETVDEEWRKVHQKCRGKKRFKKIVKKQMMVSKMQNLGAQKRNKSSAGSTGLQSQRFKPRGSIHESFLFTDLEQRRLAEIARKNEDKKNKREEYLRQNKGGNDDRESLSSGLSRRRKKWKLKKDKQGLNDDSSLDNSSLDLEASLRSLEIAFKIKEPIDEMNEESDEDDKKNDKSVEEENDDQDTENGEDGILSIENQTLEDEEENEADDEHDAENDEQEEDEDEEEESKPPIKVFQPNRGLPQVLIPPPNNFPVFTGKRRGSDKSTRSEGPSASTPFKPLHRSPRSTRRVAPELTVSPHRIRSVSGDHSPSVATSMLLSPRPSPRHFPVSPNRTPNKTPKKDLIPFRKKSLTLPKDPFTSRNARKARADRVKANPQANSVRRTGAAAQSKLPDRSPSRSRLAVRKNAANPQNSPAKRTIQKPSVKGRGGNKDKNEGGVPMQNYGTVKF